MIAGTSLFSSFYGWLMFGPKGAPPIEPSTWYTNEKAELCWQLAAKVHCPLEDLAEAPWTGVVSDFQLTKTLHWPKYDVNGMVGYEESAETIYLVWRGTFSDLNYEMNNMNALVPYDDTWPECECRVHEGVNEGMNAIFPEALEEVQKLQE
jgi:hypothetical protein